MGKNTECTKSDQNNRQLWLKDLAVWKNHRHKILKLLQIQCLST